MEDNKFLVDLSGLTLSKEQKNSINSAIQSAVMAEIAKIDTKGDRIAITKWPLGAGSIGKINFKPPRIWRGIYVELLRNVNTKVGKIG